MFVWVYECPFVLISIALLQGGDSSSSYFLIWSWFPVLLVCWCIKTICTFCRDNYFCNRQTFHQPSKARRQTAKQTNIQTIWFLFKQIPCRTWMWTWTINSSIDFIWCWISFASLIIWNADTLMDYAFSDQRWWLYHFSILCLQKCTDVSANSFNSIRP